MTNSNPTAPLAFVDCETDGVHPGRRPWEIAIIRREPDGSEREWQSFIDLGDLSVADPFGLRVGRFYERHPQGCRAAGLSSPIEGGEPVTVTRADTAARIVAAATHGAHLVGAVPNFDAEVFDRLLRAHELLPAWHYHLIDVEAMAVGWVARNGAEIHRMCPDVQLQPWPRLPWNSEDLSRAVGVEPLADDERHTALGDARWAMRMYDAITGTSL